MKNTKQINLIINKLDDAARRFSEQDILIKKSGNRFNRLFNYLLTIKRRISA